LINAGGKNGNAAVSQELLYYILRVR